MNRLSNPSAVVLIPENAAFTNRPAQWFSRGRKLIVLLPALCLLTAGAARAQQPAPVQMTQPDAASLRLRFDNPTRRPAYLTVLHLNNGETVLAETHREAAYGTRLKFDLLPTGSYAIVVRVGRNRYRYAVQVAPDAAGAMAVAVRETTAHRVENGLATAQL